MKPSFVSHALLKIRHYHRALGVRGVVLFLWSKLTGTRPLAKVRVPGIAHPVRLRIGTTDISTFLQVLVERHYDFDLPETPGFVIDAGANIGLSAVYFANRFPGARIIAIEPESTNFEMLRLNAAPYPGIVPKRAALWWREEDLDLFDSGHGNHGFQIGLEGSGQASRLGLVPGLTVEGLMRESGETGVGLLKIDIEGAEQEVLEHSAAWIDRVRILMIELHEDIRPDCTEVFRNATRGFSEDIVMGETVMKIALPQPTGAASN